MSPSTVAPPTRPRKPSGFWKVWENVVSELEKFIAGQGEPGRMPSKVVLTRAGRSDLINAIWYYGGQETVAQKLGLDLSHHPTGYWDTLARVEEALQRFMAEHGESGVMPTSEYLKEQGQHALYHAVRKHGGEAVVAERLGLKRNKHRHADHHWGNIETLRLAIEQFTQQQGLPGKLPGKNLLARHRRYDLIGAIRRHGGWHKVARLLGLAEARPQKPDGYWLDFTNVATAIHSYNQTHGTPGTMPGQSELNQAGQSALARAISVSHGGISAVADRLSLIYTGPRPPGFWQEWPNLEREILAFIQTCGTPGHMPSVETLEQHHRHDLINAIATHQGHQAVAARLGLEASYRPQGYWDSWENLEREFIRWGREHNHSGVMPSFQALTATGRADLTSAVYKHGGLLTVADKLGWHTSQGYHRFPNWDAVAEAVLQFVATDGEPGVMPSYDQFLQRGHRDLLRAIYKWGGGLTQTAYRLGLDCLYPREIKWRTWSQFAPELEAFIARQGELGIMPSAETFRTAGRHDLLRGIQVYHGGMSKVAGRLGLASAVESRGYWQDFDNVAEALFAFMETEGLAGVIPTHRLLRASGATSLSKAVLNHGGSQQVAGRLGLAYHEKSPGYWRDWDGVRQELEAFMQVYGEPGVLPTQTQLRQAGRSDLIAAIRCQGGAKPVAQRGGWRLARRKGSKRHSSSLSTT